MLDLDRTAPQFRILLTELRTGRATNRREILASSSLRVPPRQIVGGNTLRGGNIGEDPSDRLIRAVTRVRSRPLS